MNFDDEDSDISIYNNGCFPLCTSDIDWGGVFYFDEVRCTKAIRRKRAFIP
jgi:hypothetical protein